mgnify:CR=1 FL=1
MLDHTKKWLENNEFEYVQINKTRYPTKSTIINLHDFLVKHFVKEGENVYEGTMSDASLSFNGIKYYLEEKEDFRELIYSIIF